MHLFSLARRNGSSDFDARRALRPGAFFGLGFLVIRAMDTLPRCRMDAASSGKPRPNDAATTISARPPRMTPQQWWQDERVKTGAKGCTAYRKFMGECLKKAPA